jgi:Mg-chelatase subunit ChlI
MCVYRISNTLLYISVNPDSDQLDDAVDLDTLTSGGAPHTANSGAKSVTAKDGDKKIKKKIKLGRLSRSGMIKDEDEEKVIVQKSSKRKHQVDSEESENIGGEKEKEKKKKSKKNKIEKEVQDSSDKISKATGSKFSADSGVLAVQVMTGVEDNYSSNSSDKKKIKELKTSGGIDLNVLSGGSVSMMQGFGGGGSSAWD